jgi:hypothetical protein
MSAAAVGIIPTSSSDIPCFSNTASGEPATIKAVTGRAAFIAASDVSATEKLL